MKPHIESYPVPADSSFRCMERDERRWDFNWHAHLCYELVLITGGHGQCFIGDHIGQYRNGHLCLLGPNLPHSWVSSQVRPPTRNRSLCIQFAHDFLGPDFFGKPELKPISCLLEDARTGLQFTGPPVQAVISELKKIPALNGLPRLQKLLGVLHLLAVGGCCKKPLSSAALTLVPEEGNGRNIQLVLAHIHNRITGDISLAQVAATVNMTRSTFCRFFKRATGRSLTAYVSEVRIGRACALLLESDLSVSEICFQSGFSSLPYFNRRFLAAKGTTPTAYRRALHDQILGKKPPAHSAPTPRADGASAPRSDACVCSPNVMAIGRGQASWRSPLGLVDNLGERFPV